MQAGQEPNHVDPEWLHTVAMPLAGADIAINRYFDRHPEMVLGEFSRKDTLYGGEGFSVIGNGDLSVQLKDAINRLPKFQVSQSQAELPNPPPAFTPPPAERHIAEGSFFIGDDKVIHQVEDGRSLPVTYGGTLLKADGTMTGKRLAALVGLRDLARRVLQSQNDGWPEADRSQRPQGAEPGLRPVRFRLRPDQQDDLQRNRRRHGDPPHAQSSSNSAKTRTPCW